MDSTPAAASPPPPLDVTSRFPLHLTKSQIIPPAPSGSADYLFDFAGHSWIAYAAASLVVISHFPDPLSEAQTKIGPIYRQVIELSREADDVHVSAVGWSPEFPSLGELAVALGDRIVLFSYCKDENLTSELHCALILSHYFLVYFFLVLSSSWKGEVKSESDLIKFEKQKTYYLYFCRKPCIILMKL